MTTASNDFQKYFKILRETNPLSFQESLLGATPGLSNFEVRLIGSSQAYGVFENDPFGITSGIVLSTGNAKDLLGQNVEDGGFDALLPEAPNDLTTDLGDPDESGDSTSLEILFDSDGSKDTFYFQYVFGSEEFVEFGGSEFNDRFSLKLNGKNLAYLSDGRTEVTINNLVPNPYIAPHPDFVYNSVESGPAKDQTKLDGYTVPLLFSGPIIPNVQNQLLINVRDQSDGLLDSAVFLKAGTFGTVKPPEISSGGSDNGLGPGNDFPPDAELLDLTGFDGEVVVNLTLSREAGFDNLLQFYETDILGQIDGLLPREADYEKAIPANFVLDEPLFVGNNKVLDVELTLAGGTYYAPALLIAGDVDNLATVSDNTLGDLRVKRVDNVWSFEDLTDNDFNDLIVEVNSIVPVT